MSNIDEIESKLRNLIGDEKFEAIVKETEKLSDQFIKLMKNIDTLVQRIVDLMTDSARVVEIGKVGVVISVNAFGDSQIIGILGTQNGIKKAIDDVERKYKENINNKAVSKG